MKNIYVKLALVLLAYAPLAMSSPEIEFASGQAIVSLPASFIVTHDPEGLVALFGVARDHKVELTLLGQLSKTNGQRGLAVKFVLDQAAKKKIKVSESPGRAVLMEVGGNTEVKGRTNRIVHWQVGAGNCVFTLTVTAPLPMSRDLDTFLGEPLNEIIRNVRCKAL